jgi:hypothetical protein
MPQCANGVRSIIIWSTLLNDNLIIRQSANVVAEPFDLVDRQVIYCRLKAWLCFTNTSMNIIPRCMVSFREDPKGVIKRIHYHRLRMLWKTREINISFINWPTICLSKEALAFWIYKPGIRV